MAVCISPDEESFHSRKSQRSVSRSQLTTFNNLLSSFFFNQIFLTVMIAYLSVDDRDATNTIPCNAIMADCSTDTPLVSNIRDNITHGGVGIKHLQPFWRWVLS